jgi:hypothetical protein
MTDLEKTAEDMLVEGVEACGGFCKKLVEVGKRGFPDRQIFWAGRKPTVELKRAASGELSPQQEEVIKQLNSAFCDVYVLWGVEGVKQFLTLLEHSILPPETGRTIHLPVQ